MRRKKLPPLPLAPLEGMMCGRKNLISIEKQEIVSRVRMIGADDRSDHQHWSRDPSYGWAYKVRNERNES